MRLTMTSISAERLPGCNAHSHDQWEIILCLRGRARLMVGEKAYAFEEGVIACLPPDIPHYLEGLPDYQDMFLRIQDFAPPGRDEVPIFHDDEEKRFLTLARMLYQAFFSKEPNGPQLTNALLEAMLQLLVGWSMGGSPEGPVASLVREMIYNIPNHEFDISEHMRRSGYCSDHFRRCFKKEMGKTPTAYMISLRLDHARRLLELPGQGGYTIKQIAHMSGFSDPYYFSTMFRKNFGRSPMLYLEAKENEESILSL